MSSAWPITCLHCEKKTQPANIVELMEHYRDPDGWIICECGERGFIEKEFKLQEEGEIWEFRIHRVSRLVKDATGPYQPLAFWISHYPPEGPINAIWFSYYKDLRNDDDGDGRLKMGHGPGGPPVVDISAIHCLSEELKREGLE